MDQVECAAPERNVLEILVLYLNVCPQGMITRDVQHYIEQEAVCETYKTSPKEGGTDEWPGLLYDAFLTIRQTQQQIQIEKRKKTD